MYEIRETKTGAIVAQNVDTLHTALKIVDTWGRYDNRNASERKYDIYLVKPQKVVSAITAKKALELYKKGG